MNPIVTALQLYVILMDGERRGPRFDSLEEARRWAKEARIRAPHVYRHWSVMHNGKMLPDFNIQVYPFGLNAVKVAEADAIIRQQVIDITGTDNIYKIK